ncbi:hypothetical protein MLD38_001087 [Melastoma candidum]|uniref:Uncharacterized protein n=1 Tax=Melastoma candidum TaxID=119954 RepID=A0ACB9SG21_9MYRT|nr:hypothetical protein MLD38_001087 [Melastoma candidum]
MASASRLSYLRLRDDGFSPDHDDILERFLRRRAKFVAAVRVSCRKVIKRLKESQSHFGDLFAGNYLFLQVNPTPLKTAAVKKSYEVHRAFPGIPSAIAAP